MGAAPYLGLGYMPHLQVPVHAEQYNQIGVEALEEML